MSENVSSTPLPTMGVSLFLILAMIDGMHSYRVIVETDISLTANRGRYSFLCPSQIFLWEISVQNSDPFSTGLFVFLWSCRHSLYILNTSLPHREHFLPLCGLCLFILVMMSFAKQVFSFDEVDFIDVLLNDLVTLD